MLLQQDNIKHLTAPLLPFKTLTHSLSGAKLGSDFNVVTSKGLPRQEKIDCKGIPYPVIKNKLF